MLMGLCGGGLMLEYQKSVATAQPHQHPSFCCSKSEPRRVVGARCGDIKNEAKESQRTPADRLGAASAKT
jgi:predicted nucleic acid-binding Zn ribbon protein